MPELTLDQKFDLILKDIGDTKNILSQKIDEVVKTQQNQNKIIENQNLIIKKQDAKIDTLESIVMKLTENLKNQTKLIEKQDHKMDKLDQIVELLSVRSFDMKIIPNLLRKIRRNLIKSVGSLVIRSLEHESEIKEDKETS